MQLSELLPKVLRLVGDIGCDHVTIARTSVLRVNDQIRFEPDRELGYRITCRRWLDTRQFTESFSQRRIGDRVYTADGKRETDASAWSKWLPFVGFTVECVLAIDWDLID